MDTTSTARRGATWPPSRPQVIRYRTRRRSRPRSTRPPGCPPSATPCGSPSSRWAWPHRAHPPARSTRRTASTAPAAPGPSRRHSGTPPSSARTAPRPSPRRRPLRRVTPDFFAAHPSPTSPAAPTTGSASRAGSPSPCTCPRARPLRADHLGARPSTLIAEELRALDSPDEAALLHLGPHQQRGRVPLPALRPRVRHQQPARLLQHVPRVLRLRADRDHRHRQGQRLPRGPPPGRPDHRRRAEPGHQPPAHAHRAGEGQDRRREDRLASTRCPRPAWSASRTRRPPAAWSARAPRSPTCSCRSASAATWPSSGSSTSSSSRPRRRHRRRRSSPSTPTASRSSPPPPAPPTGTRPSRATGLRRARDRAALAHDPRLAAHHRLLGDGPHPAQALRRHHPRGRQRPAAARQHRPPRRRRLPGPRPLQRPGRPHHGHLRTPRARLPRRPRRRNSASRRRASTATTSSTPSAPCATARRRSSSPWAATSSPPPPTPTSPRPRCAAPA